VVAKYGGNPPRTVNHLRPDSLKTEAIAPNDVKGRLRFYSQLTVATTKIVSGQSATGVAHVRHLAAGAVSNVNLSPRMGSLFGQRLKPERFFSIALCSLQSLLKVLAYRKCLAKCFVEFCDSGKYAETVPLTTASDLPNGAAVGGAVRESCVIATKLIRSKKKCLKLETLRCLRTGTSRKMDSHGSVDQILRLII
jgi:hypothetical protein